MKGLIEKFFDLVQESYKKHLKGKGVIEPDYQERGAHDYRKDACLTMTDFEKIVLHCIIYYNSQRIIESFPYTEDMIAAQVKPYASQIWNWGKSQIGANLIEIGKRELMLTLLPRTTGKFSRSGLKVNKLRYHCEGYTEQYLSGGDMTAVQELQESQKVIARGAVRDNLQAQINLAQHIEAIVGSGAGHGDVHMKDIRSTRRQEQTKNHRDYMKEGTSRE